MLTGAFFGAWGADVTLELDRRRWSIGMAGGRAYRPDACRLRRPLRADQIVSGMAINFLALGVTGYLFVQDLRRRRARPTTCPQIPDVHLPIGWIPFVGDALEQLNLLIWLGLILVAVLSRLPVPHADAACACARSARTRWPPIRPASRRSRAALPRRDHLGRARVARRRVPVDRLRPLVQPEHDRRPGFIGARRRDLRQVEAGRRARARRCCSASRARWRSGCRCSRRAPRRCSRRCRTC